MKSIVVVGFFLSGLMFSNTPLLFVYPNDGYLVTGSEKSVTNEGVVYNNLKLISNMILRAADYNAALELAKECPVLKQGGMIEVREIQARPNSNA